MKKELFAYPRVLKIRIDSTLIEYPTLQPNN